MNIKELSKLIKQHEGFRSKIYLDTEGIPTGGYGHAFLLGSKLPDIIWEAIFNHDLETALADFYSLKIYGLNHVRKSVVVSMCFQLGLNNVYKFSNFLAALRNGDFKEAAYQMKYSAKRTGKRSKWYSQCPGRVEELATMMQTGQHSHS